MNLWVDPTGLFEGIVSYTGVGVICTAILIYAIGNYAKFRRRMSPQVVELERYCRYLERTQDEQAFAHDFVEFNDEVRKSSLLRHIWHEFFETLLMPEPDADSGREVIRNTIGAGAYFSRQSLLHSKVDLRYYSAVPNFLTGMGILGTFIGLVAGIYLASHGLGGDANQAKAALQELLHGASLAFLTSIVGLVCSISFSVGEKAWIHKFDRLLSRWVEGLDTRLERVTPEMLNRDLLVEAKQQTAVFSAFTTDLAFQLAKALDETVNAPLGELMERVATAVEGLREDRAHSNEQMLHNIVEKFSSSISGAAGQEMTAFADTLRQLNDGVAGGIGQLGESVADIARVTENAQKLVADSEALIRSAKEAYEGLAKATSPIEDAAKQIREASQTLDSTTGQMASAGETVAQSVENMAGMHEEVRDAWADYQKRFAQVDGSLQRTFEQIDEALARYTNSMGDFVGKLDQHTSTIVRDLAGAVKELGEGVEELGDVLTRRPAEGV